MKRGQLAAVIIIVLLVAVVAGFLIFSQKKAGRAILALSQTQQQQQYYTQQQYPPQPSDQTISTTDGGTSSDSLIDSGPCTKVISCGCIAPGFTWEGNCEPEDKDKPPKGGSTDIMGSDINGKAVKKGTVTKTIKKGKDGKLLWSCTFSGASYLWFVELTYPKCPQTKEEGAESGTRECKIGAIAQWGCGWLQKSEGSFAQAAAKEFKNCLDTVISDKECGKNGYTRKDKIGYDNSKITFEFKGFTDKKT